MFRYVLSVGLAAVLAVGVVGAGRADDKKTDADTKVAEGTEVSLTPVEVMVDEKADDQGRHPVTVREKKAAKVKMPAQGWTLGFHPEKEKDGGLKVTGVVDSSGLFNMRTEPGKDDGVWQADEGDVITHVNGYAVNSVEELLVALALAKKPHDVQLVIKDVTTGKLTAFYATATKR